MNDDLSGLGDELSRHVTQPPFANIVRRGGRRRATQFGMSGLATVLVVTAAALIALNVPTDTADLAPARTGAPAATSPAATKGGAPSATSWAGFFQLTDISFVDRTHGWVTGISCGDESCAPFVRTSTDGGASWRALTAPMAQVDTRGGGFDPYSHPARIHFADRRNGWLTFEKGIAVTHDAGETWGWDDKLGHPTVDRNVYDLATAGTSVWSAEAGCRLTMGALCDAQLMVGRTDGGLMAPASPQPPLGQQPVPDDRLNGGIQLLRAGLERAWLVVDRGAAVGDDALLVTADSGLTWTSYPHPCRDVAHRGFGARFVAPSAGHLFGFCLGGASGGQQFRTAVSSVDGGRTWSMRDASATGYLIDLVATPDVIWAMSLDGLSRSTDGGRTFADIPLHYAHKDDQQLSNYSLTFVDATHGWFIAGPNRVVRTEDGSTWTEGELRCRRPTPLLC